MSGYVGIDNTGKSVPSIYIGVNNIAHSVQKAYVGVNGVAKLWFQQGEPIGNSPVGTSVFFNVDGIKTEWIIVHQGNPSTSLYDSSCNGTWLLMKNIYTESVFGSNNSYSASTIHNTVLPNLINVIDEKVRNIIKDVKIPYRKGSGWGSSVGSGSSGLSTKAFLLSVKEVGMSNFSHQPNDGVKLDYFLDGTGTDANDKRIAYYNGTALTWFSRSPDTAASKSILGAFKDGSRAEPTCTNAYGIRPAIIVPQETLIGSNGSLIA